MSSTTRKETVAVAFSLLAAMTTASAQAPAPGAQATTPAASPAAATPPRLEMKPPARVSRESAASADARNCLEFPSNDRKSSDAPKSISRTGAPGRPRRVDALRQPLHAGLCSQVPVAGRRAGVGVPGPACRGAQPCERPVAARRRDRRVRAPFFQQHGARARQSVRASRPGPRREGRQSAQRGADPVRFDQRTTTARCARTRPSRSTRRSPC